MTFRSPGRDFGNFGNFGILSLEIWKQRSKGITVGTLVDIESHTFNQKNV